MKGKPKDLKGKKDKPKDQKGKKDKPKKGKGRQLTSDERRWQRANRWEGLEWL
jgi:hypothetical protein